MTEVDVKKSKTEEEKRIADLNLEAYHKVMQLTGVELLNKLTELNQSWLTQPVDLNQTELKMVGSDLFIRKSGETDFAHMNPLENDADVFWVMTYFTILKDYEHYNCIGENFYASNAKNPIRFWEHDSEGLPGLPNTHPVHLCICRAAVLGLHHEFNTHLS